jgi:hypothetical protein
LHLGCWWPCIMAVSAITFNRRGCLHVRAAPIIMMH